MLDQFQLSDATVADEVIDLLGTKSIESLAALVVNSAAFRGFKTSKMFQHFDRHLKSDSCGNPDPREALAFALLSVDVGGAESVRDVLRRMKTAQFAGKCSTVPSLISVCVSVLQFAATVEHSEQCTISSQFAFQSLICRFSK